jgi:transcriptional regulator with GAF, ATPase, and Fis domain
MSPIVFANSGVAVENALAFQEIEALKDKLAKENAYLEEEVRTGHNFGEIVGDSGALRRVLKQVETAAPTGSTVLIRGDTGTGKERIARALHGLSPRKAHTFVKLNCAAIPTGLLESELFGHEKGAFTGAIAHKVGRFELAHQGTLFLHEVGDIPRSCNPSCSACCRNRSSSDWDHPDPQPSVRAGEQDWPAQLAHSLDHPRPVRELVRLASSV